MAKKVKLGKFIKMLDKLIFWMDFEKLAENKCWLIVFVVAFILALVWVPFAVIAITAFIGAIR